MKKLTSSFKFAVDGIVNTTRVEKNLKIQLISMVFVIALGAIVGLSAIEWIICILLFGLVISAEMFNTAIEKTLDYVNEEHDERIKFIKDCSAGSVLIMAIASAVIGLVIFLPKLILLF